MKHHQHRQHYSPAAERAAQRANERAAAGLDFLAVLIVAAVLTVGALAYFDILTRGF